MRRGGEMMRPSVQGVDHPVCCVLDAAVTYARDSSCWFQEGLLSSRGGGGRHTGTRLTRSMWILCMTSSLSSHSTSALVSKLSRLVTHTAVSLPKCNSENRPLSNSVAFQTLFKWHRYCGILKIHIIRKINTGIRYEPVYCPALATPRAYGYKRATGASTD